MSFLRLYYEFKPVIPRSLQICVRRHAARRLLPKVADRWPILESAGHVPPGWPGWPDGKRFALVLTHDVETGAGQPPCRMIMDLEERLGFRSCFNFVPRRYEVSAELRAEMGRRGFEVGVHGLVHDGRLFKSRRVFLQRAAAINGYLREWGAAGFRAPSMIVNLRWIPELNIQYDSSTFDTDPFEPVPEGAGTVFPHLIVPSEGHPGYLELPYTLPQDFTLYLIFGERDIGIWKKKLDWIAARGGMALLNTHPDYMAADEDDARRDRYSPRLYREFLEYVRDTYKGAYWHARPVDVARYCESRRDAMPRRSLRRVCMLAYAFYDTDNRIIRYTDTLLARGDHVDVVCLGRPGQPRETLRPRNRVLRIQTRRRDEKRSFTYLSRIMRFWLGALLTVSRDHRRQPYDLIHVHSVPDFLVFAAWYARRRGARVILDVHDLVPEFYASKFCTARGGFMYRLLLRLERSSGRFAHHVIASNDLWQRKLVERAVAPEKSTVILNYADPRLFYARPRTRADSGFVLLYPGGFQTHQGLDIAIRAFALFARQIPQAALHLYGEGSEEPALRTLVGQFGLKERVLFKGIVPIAQMPQIIADADVGIVAKRGDSFGGEAYSTKILEYMSQGLPCLVSRTPIDTFYFNDDVVLFFRSGDAEDMADKMLRLARDGQLRARLAANGRAYFERNNWEVKKDAYLNVVNRLLARGQE